jgi:penicillin-insensitive murein endopeptidase
MKRAKTIYRISAATSLILLAASMHALAEPSRCFGTVGKGRIERSVKLPESGANFTSYASIASAMGRTHVHSTVNAIIVEAYGELAAASPSTRFVYGETGWPAGGRLRPHRTHQNGLSVDFFVPVRDAAGRSVVLPATLSNRLGYDIEFDQHARFNGMSIDFPAMAEHLYQLHIKANKHGVGIALVIVDPSFLPRLFATARGDFLKRNLPFMRRPAWVRHDEHYHVDFAIACLPLGA